MIREHFREDGEPKVRYKALWEAEQSALDMWRLHGMRFVSYHCTFCDGYHIGRRH